MLMLLFILLVVLMGVNFFIYNKNMKLQLRRDSEEGDTVRKIRSFVDRCESFKGQLLSPMQEDGTYSDADSRNVLSPQFIELMLKVVPYVLSHKKDDLTLGKLAEAGDVDIAQLYDIVSGNLYKNPRDLIRIIRIEQGAQLLRTTQLSVEEVANKCDFYTPNYFIGSFFHKYKLTPKEYREELKA